jgi:hypothetical protein
LISKKAKKGREFLLVDVFGDTNGEDRRREFDFLQNLEFLQQSASEKSNVLFLVLLLLLFLPPIPKEPLSSLRLLRWAVLGCLQDKVPTHWWASRGRGLSVLSQIFLSVNPPRRSSITWRRRRRETCRDTYFQIPNVDDRVPTARKASHVGMVHCHAHHTSSAMAFQRRVLPSSSLKQKRKKLKKKKKKEIEDH